jgi:hypothetical protein
LEIKCIIYFAQDPLVQVISKLIQGINIGEEESVQQAIPI